MPLQLPARPATWLFTGDSITQGVQHTYRARTWYELAYERIRYQCGRFEDVVVNTAVSGWTSRMIVDRYDWLIGRFQPDIVSISLGTNDAKIDWDQHADPAGLVAAITEIVERSRESGTEQFLIHTPVLTMKSALATRPALDDYAAALRAAAPALGAVLVDHHDRWRQRWGDAEPIGWLDDHIHPNAAGHQVMAATFFDAAGLGPFEDLQGA